MLARSLSSKIEHHYDNHDGGVDDDDGVDCDQGGGDDDIDESLCNCNGYHDDITQDQESVWCC